MKVFEDGYNKDYIYEERKYNLNLVYEEGKNLDFDLKSKSKQMYRGSDIILLTMRGAIKFNM